MQHLFSLFQTPALRLAVLAVLAVPGAVQAVERLDPIVVTTPMRMAQTVDETLHPVTVVTREDIERRQPADVPALLRGLPGVQVSSSGGFGKQSSVFLRGSNSNQLIVLIDGVRAGSATAGGAAWEFIPVDQIERVEVVRGPRASAYGADAVGGVIQIFTRGAAGGSTREVSAGYGRFDTRKASVSLGDQGQAFRYHLGFSHVASDGYDVRSDGDPDDDGFRNDSLNLRLGYAASSGLDIEARLLRAEGETDFDNAFGMPGESREDFVQQATSVRMSAPIGAGLHGRLTVGETRDERDTTDAGFDFRFDTRRQNVTAELDWETAIGDMTLGADYLEDRVNSSVDYARDRRDTQALFAQLQSDFGQHRLGAGLRHDRYSDFDDRTTGDLAWGYRFTEAWDFRASAGTAFRAPTFNELYFPFGGNAELKPERSRNLEAGLTHFRGAHELSVTTFQNRIRDLIVLDANFIPQNASRARITGVETEWSWSTTEWRASAAYTWLRALDEETDLQLPRRARDSLRLDLDRDLDRASLGASVVGQGRRFDDRNNTVELPAYATLDLRAGYRLNPEWTASATWTNVLDRDYETVAGYPQPGQAFNLELRGAF
jgi:vitamin B12 transporter